MLIDRIYGLILPRFRARRFAKFVAELQPQNAESILDVGGRPNTWTEQSPLDARIEVLNNETPPEFDAAAYPHHKITQVVGDGTALDYAEAAFSIAFSNSVIEHVGDDAAQERFANEIRRVGRAVWVQTPAQEFFFEPHFLTPFFHWLPLEQRVGLGRFTVWGLLTRANRQDAERHVREVRLLRRERMEELFPDCEIQVERSLGMTKSFVAVRRAAPVTPD